MQSLDSIETYTYGTNKNFSLVFITQSYIAVPKNIGLNSIHYFIMKIPNKQDLQQKIHSIIHRTITLKTS